MAKDFESLVNTIQSVSDTLISQTMVVINRNVTARAWLTGYYIVEYEQNGEDRAKYGEKLLKNLVDKLDNSFSVETLKKNRKFYQTYPELSGPIAGYLMAEFGKGESVITRFALTDIEKGKSVITQSTGKLLVSGDDDIPKINPDILFDRLSYTHFTQLLYMDDLQRTFYAYEAIRGTWSVRELKRQIDSNYYTRIGWSNKPEVLSEITHGKASIMTAKESIRSPHVFEFLGLATKDVWEESDLEQGIIDHLENFILEMGLGFCYEARQKKLLIDDVYYKVDLVFYHRILKCHVLIELKASKMDYTDVAQLNMYMAYYRENIMESDDNPPIGLLMCTEVGKEMAEYVTSFTDPQLFISKYQLNLPPKEKILEFLKRENQNHEEV